MAPSFHATTTPSTRRSHPRRVAAQEVSRTLLRTDLALVAHQHAVRAKSEPRLVVEELDRVQVARDAVRRRVELV